MKENADKARALDAAELNKQLADTSEQMFRLRFQMSMGQMDGVKKVRSLRKERARMLTILRERELHPDQVGKIAAPKAKKARAVSKPSTPKPAAASKSASEKPKKAAAASHKTAAKPRADSKPKAAPRARKSTKG